MSASLKNAACMVVLIRPPMPTEEASFTASMMKNFAFLAASARFMEAGSCLSSSSALQGQFSRNVPPSFRGATMSYLVTYAGLWQAMKSAESIR